MSKVSSEDLLIMYLEFNDITVFVGVEREKPILSLFSKPEVLEVSNGVAARVDRRSKEFTRSFSF